MGKAHEFLLEKGIKSNKDNISAFLMEQWLEEFLKTSEKQALNITDVSKQRELLIAFKTWEVDNDIKNLLPEQLADFYLDEVESKIKLC